MRETNHDVTVGTFVLLGLLVMAGLVITFGRLEGLMSDNYVVTVEAKNANGVLKDSLVYFRGAQVGRVLAPPFISDQGSRVIVQLRLRKDIEVPKNAKIHIGERGLLGDRYVEITPPDDPSDEILKDGDVVQATPPRGLNDIIGRLDQMTEKLEKQLLTDETLESIKGTISSTKEAVDKASGLMDQGKETMGSINDAVTEVNAYLEEAKSGKGPLHLILKDEEAADRMRDLMENAQKLVYNLRVRGLLFYRDVAGEEENAVEPGDALKTTPEPLRLLDKKPDWRARN